jgi:hypothetical protein
MALPLTPTPSPGIEPPGSNPGTYFCLSAPARGSLADEGARSNRAQHFGRRLDSVAGDIQTGNYGRAGVHVSLGKRGRSAANLAARDAVLVLAPSAVQDRPGTQSVGAARRSAIHSGETAEVRPRSGRVTAPAYANHPPWRLAERHCRAQILQNICPTHAELNLRPESARTEAASPKGGRLRSSRSPAPG